MRVLYVAGTPDGDDSLLELSEVTELALLFRAQAGLAPEFDALPDTPIHLLRGMINRFNPDVLHLAAHGETRAIKLRDFDGVATPVTADTLRRFLVRDGPVSFVYLNACNSAELAKSLSETVPAVIGFQGKVQNATARHAALHFYEEVFAGKSLEQAFEISSAFVNAAEDGKKCSCILEGSPSAKRLRLYVPLVLKARIKKVLDDTGYLIEVGVEGVPANTSQIVFCLAEPTLEDEARTVSAENPNASEITLAGALCRIIGRPRGNSTIWTTAPYVARGNCNLSATLSFPDRPAIATSARLSDALKKGLADNPELLDVGQRAAIDRLATFI